MILILSGKHEKHVSNRQKHGSGNSCCCCCCCQRESAPTFSQAAQSPGRHQDCSSPSGRFEISPRSDLYRRGSINLSSACLRSCRALLVKQQVVSTQPSRFESETRYLVPYRGRRRRRRRNGYDSRAFI